MLARFRFALAVVALVAAGFGLVASAPTVVLNALVSEAGYRLIARQPYGGLPRQTLDIYRPTQPPLPAGYPVAVFFYGGSWNRGERADYKFVGAALASRGILTLVADYRLYPQVRYPDFLVDGALAVGYALRQAAALGGDPRRVYVIGHSAGAYNAAMLAIDGRWLRSAGYDPSELAGWVGLAGPYDFLPIVNPDVRPVFNHPDYPPGTQVFDHITASAPRAFIGAARTDELVDPVRNSVGLANRLQAAGRPVTLKLYDRVDHATLAAAFAQPLRWMAPVLDDVVSFIETR